MTSPQPSPTTTGVRAFLRFALFVGFTLAFIALAVATVVTGGPWFVGGAYLISALVVGTLAQKLFPRRVSVSSPREAGAAPNKRSGNPAVRAETSKPRDRGDSAASR